MNTQNAIKSLFAKSRVVVSPEVDERMSRSTLGAFDGAAGVRPARLLRKAMIKMAAGIVVLAAIAGLLIHFGVAFDGAQVALAQVRRALNEAAWVHVLLTATKTPGQVTRHELWFSPRRQIRAHKSDDPNLPILWSDYVTRERQCYEPKSGRLTLAYEYKQAPAPGDLPWSYLGYLFGPDLPARARVTERIETFGQTEAKVYHVVMEEDEGLAQFHISTDRASALPLTMRIDVVDTTGQERATLEARFEYPTAGPRDVYDIGVPRAATVVDERPTPEVEELARICKTYRANLQSCVLAAVQTWGQGTLHQIDVCYVQGDTSRAGREWKSLDFLYVPWPPQDLPIGPLASVEDVLNWIQHDDRLTLLRVGLWDGRYQHSVEVDNYRERVHRKSRDIGGRKDLHGYAWPCYLPSGRIIEDEYSKARGLVCWKPPDGRTLYFDPRHDYVCTRHEQSGGTWIRDTMDFARTDAGLWYPRTVQLTIVETGAAGQEVSREVTAVDKLFLKPIPAFPRGTFDSGNLAALIGSKQAAFQLLEGRAP
jgi:hypothetical protein